MVYLLHYRDEKGRLSHHVVFVKGSLFRPAEVYVLPFTPALSASLNRLGISYKRVAIPGDETEDAYPVCNAHR